MRIRKSILTLFAAISIATTSINPVNIYAWGHDLSGEYSNDMFSPINTKAHINEHYNYSIDTSSLITGTDYTTADLYINYGNIERIALKISVSNKINIVPQIRIK